MAQTNNTAKSVVYLMVFTLSSKFLGFFRESLIAAKFGSSSETDVFFVALTATSVFSSLLTHSLNTTMIPVLAEIELNENKQGKMKHTNNILNIVVLVSILVISVAWLAAPLIIRILAKGFEGVQFELAVFLTRIGLPVVLFAGLLGVFRGYLQSEKRFFESGISEFPFNFVYIAYLLLLSNKYGIRGLMIASVLAVTSQIILQIPALKNLGYKYEGICNLQDIYINKLTHMIPPVLVGVAINDINKIVDRTLASTLIEGSISALNYSSRIDSLIIGIFVTAILTVLFPMISERANGKKFDSLRNLIEHAINTILIVTIPATVGLMVLATPIVRIAFERGVFDSTATLMTSGALLFYSTGLVGTSIKLLTYRSFYALSDTKTPMIDGIFTVFLNLILNLLLINRMGHLGLALSTSIATTITSIFLLFRLKRKIGDFGLFRTFYCFLKATFSALIMGAVIKIVFEFMLRNFGMNLETQIFSLFITTGIGILIYISIIFLLKLKEFIWFINLLNRKNIPTRKK